MRLGAEEGEGEGEKVEVGERREGKGRVMVVVMRWLGGEEGGDHWRDEKYCEGWLGSALIDC